MALECTCIRSSTRVRVPGVLSERYTAAVEVAMTRLTLWTLLVGGLASCELETECRELGYTAGASYGQVCEPIMSLSPDEPACTGATAGEVASMQENFWTGYCDEHLNLEASDGTGCGSDGAIACERAGL